MSGPVTAFTATSFDYPSTPTLTLPLKGEGNFEPPLDFSPMPLHARRLAVGLQQEAHIGINVGVHVERLEIGGPRPDARRLD